LNKLQQENVEDQVIYKNFVRKYQVDPRISQKKVKTQDIRINIKIPQIIIKITNNLETPTIRNQTTKALRLQSQLTSLLNVRAAIQSSSIRNPEDLKTIWQD